MSFSKYLTSLRHDVVRHAAAYPAARARHAALESLESPEHVLRALTFTSGTAPEVRNAIVVALLEEHRTSRSPLWQAMLITAFRPMLLNLRWRVGRKGDAADLDQDVLLAFLGALRSVAPNHYAVAALRWATQKEVFRGIELESRVVATIPYDDDTHPVDVFGADVRDRERAAEIVNILEMHGDELLEVVLATHAGNERFTGRVFVDDKWATQFCRAFCACEYQRLALARRHVVSTIRASYVRMAA